MEQDNELRQLTDKLKVVERRMKHLQAALEADHPLTKGLIGLQERKAQTLRQLIRAREYALGRRK
jgi:hypothetical protein